MIGLPGSCKQPSCVPICLRFSKHWAEHNFRSPDSATPIILFLYTSLSSASSSGSSVICRHEPSLICLQSNGTIPSCPGGALSLDRPLQVAVTVRELASLMASGWVVLELAVHNPIIFWKRSAAREHGTDRLPPQAEGSQGFETRPEICAQEKVTDLRFLSPRQPPQISYL